MKKFIFLLACASLMATSATAQVALVKEAAKAFGGNLDAKTEALEKIIPACTNPETAEDANTWLTVGKLALGIADEYTKLKVLGKEVDKEVLDNALEVGYASLEKALPLDSVPEIDKKTGAPKLDKEGKVKVKTKYSKEILSLLGSHSIDVAQMGDLFLADNKYAQAGKAYMRYLNLLQSPVASLAGISVPADTILGNYNFLAGYCKFFADADKKDYAGAFDLFSKALNLGYTGNQCKEFRNAAFLSNVQGLMADDSQKDQVIPFIDSAIASDPTAPNYYDIKGQVLMGDNKFTEAKELFKAAMGLDAEYGDSYLNYARALYEEANAFIAANSQMTDAQLKPTLIPIYEEAMPYLQRAVQLDKSENKMLEKQAKSLIEDIDYKFELLGHKK